MRTTLACLLSAIGLLAAAAPSSAIVGGRDASPGEYPAVAEVTLGGAFGCTGTLIAPTWVLTAGHCGSLTGAAVATPIAWPTPLIDVRIGSITPGAGEHVPVRRALIPPEHLATSGHDITLLELSRPSIQAPAPVAGPSETALWAPGTLETIVGFGVTEEGGDAPDVLQEAEVPIVADPDCEAAYPDEFDETMICAGYPEGGVDTCQGDSGGPMFGRTATGALRVVGATSFGEGCARPGRYGVYARVADDPLRSWIAAQAPAGVAG
ncbi:MAG TPA: serine protease [Capillimicrobium sp.]|nr:serine protease [Capillimicrobium sp.]